LAIGLKETIQTFLDLGRLSHDADETREEFSYCIPPKGSSTSKTSDSLGSVPSFGEHSIPESFTQTPAIELIDYSRKSSTEQCHQLKATKGISVRSGNLQCSLPSTRNIAPLLASTRIEPPIFQKTPWEALETNDLSFAGRLQRAAFKAGYHLANNAKQDFVDFQRVFNRVLNFNTHENLLSFLSNVVSQNFEGLLEQPQPTSLCTAAQRELPSWLNATEVSYYFHEKGFDFDQSTLYAELPIDTTLTNGDATMAFGAFILPSLQSVSLGPQKAPSTYAQDYNFLPLSYSHNLIDFKSSAINAPAKRRIKVDVKKLINGKLLPCSVPRSITH
jgi:hypothetical protein